MKLIKKIIFFLVKVELNTLNTKNLKYTQYFSFNYINSLPNFYRFPVYIFLTIINFLPVFAYGNFLYNLDYVKAQKYLNFLLNYFPFFTTFKKFYRTIFLLANFS